MFWAFRVQGAYNSTSALNGPGQLPCAFGVICEFGNHERNNYQCLALQLLHTANPRKNDVD